MTFAPAIHRVRGVVRRLLDPRRRFNCQDQNRESWELRAEHAAELLAQHLARSPTERLQVGDFGCGNERLRSILERSLERPFDYHGYDLHPQSPRVERIDLNRQLPDSHLDAVFCLGLLEYLSDVPTFLVRLVQVCRFAVVSYVLADALGALPTPERRKRGWANDFTRSDLEELFVRAGFTRRDFAVIDEGSSALWLWERAGTAETAG